LKIAAAVLAVLVVGTVIGCFAYWQYLITTPQYSLALLVDAAKRDDQPTVGELVDSDAVIDDMLPQVVNKAIEIYGRGMTPTAIARLTQIAQPLIPTAKQRAREQLPMLIQRQTSKFGDVAFPLMVVGAGRFLDIRVEGDTAYIKSKNPENTTEAKMVRNGDRWKITGVRDDRLAAEIAQRIGQEMIALAMSGKKTGLGVKSIDDLIEQMRQATE
jgi:hypothetical protein